MTYWAEIENDLWDQGIDLDDRAMLDRRTWRWFKTKIYGLLGIESRLIQALRRDRQPAQAS